MIISLISGVASLYMIWWGVSFIENRFMICENQEDNIDEATRLRRAVSFFFGLIVVQGSISYKRSWISQTTSCILIEWLGGFANGTLGNINRQLTIRFLTGAWCLTCFVLVTAYSSVLVSFMTAPDSYKPIINSVNDLPAKPNVHITVNKNLIADTIFQVLLIIYIWIILKKLFTIE